MRLIIIGSLKGHMGEAGKIAIKRGAKVFHCEDAEEALGALRHGKGADAALVDLKQDICGFIQSLAAERIHMPVIACGIEAAPREAAQAIKDGAMEYMPLPPNKDLIAAILEAVSNEQNDIIAADPSMVQVIEFVKKIAKSAATVLITGESGTGKEVISKLIHQKSDRAGETFIGVNCAAIPENLLESELFGYEKGAFTGATNRRIGKFEEAHKGTILLDEISEMAPQLQAKLLRVLQEKEITRVGSNEAVPVDVRIIATSNRDLEAYVEDGNFREDLYFRLNVMQVELPALRDRPADLIPLSEFFLKKYAEENNAGSKSLSEEAKTKIREYGWRGNVRELEHTMHRAVLLSVGEEVGEDDIVLKNSAFANKAISKPAPVSTTPLSEEQDDGLNPAEKIIGRSLKDIEREMILNTMSHTLGDKNQAAKILGISIRVLSQKLEDYQKAG